MVDLCTMFSGIQLRFHKRYIPGCGLIDGIQVGFRNQIFGILLMFYSAYSDNDLEIILDAICGMSVSLKVRRGSYGLCQDEFVMLHGQHPCSAALYEGRKAA